MRIEEDRRKFVKRLKKAWKVQQRRQSEEAMLNRLKEEPWMAEILRKNFTEEEVEKEWFTKKGTVSAVSETGHTMGRISKRRFHRKRKAHN